MTQIKSKQITGKKEVKAQEKSMAKPKGQKWDGRSRITTKAYRENYDAIYKRIETIDNKEEK
jgi:hypothetical protein